MMKIQFLSYLFLFLLLACSPKTNVVNLSTSKRPITQDYEPFALFEKDTVALKSSQLIGEIEIKDSGFSLRCDYETVKGTAIKQAKEMGGNCLVIIEHKLPSKWSTCHRIKAKIYVIEDAHQYESEILWSAKRPLKIRDFKGAIDKRPFQAATASSFRYYIEGKPGFSKDYNLSVQTYFDCYLSYFKHSEIDSAVLAHEQIHFDISELYARKFIKEMERDAKNIDEAIAKQEILLDEIGRELRLKQDEYDTEVYADDSKQINWTNWIKEELTKTKAYENKTLSVKAPKKK